MSHIKISEIKINPANPRVIKDDRFYKLVRSIAHFPAMLSKRGIVVDKNRMSLGGNQRKRGIEHILTMPDADFQKLMEPRQDLIPFWDGLRQKKSIPENWVVDGSDFTDDEIRRFVIADNVSFGELDMDALANEWDAKELQEWGLDLPVFADISIGTDGFSLPDGDKEPFQQMTFTLADEQATQIKNAISDIKETEEYKYAETMGNENSNGNALYLIVMQWAGQRK